MHARGAREERDAHVKDDDSAPGARDSHRLASDGVPEKAGGA
jgi:hypothetical protein